MVYVENTGWRVPSAVSRENDLYELDATEPLGRGFESSVARRLGCRGSATATAEAFTQRSLWWRRVVEGGPGAGLLGF